MNDFQFLFARGLKGEALIREWLKAQGYLVLPTSLIANGGAPALEGHLMSVIAANNLVAKDGKVEWVEVKTYQRATKNQRRGRWEHGVPVRLWNEYRKGELLTGIPGCLVILQVDAGRILKGRLADIEVGAYTQAEHEKTPRSGRQIFFDVRRFDWFSIDSLSPLNDMMPDDLAPQTVRPWEHEGKQSTPASKQGMLL